MGTSLTRGAELMEVHGGTPPEAGAILGALLNCSAVRTLYQDTCYGVRQLVDIAIRALSPAVNDPTTAVQTLDRLHGIMRSIANRPDPSGLYVDGSGLVRLIVPVPGWDRVFDLAFTEIALDGAGSPQISRKLMATFDDLAAFVPPERNAVIDAQRAWLRNEVPQRSSLSPDRVLIPDALGLG